MHSVQLFLNRVAKATLSLWAGFDETIDQDYNVNDKIIVNVLINLGIMDHMFISHVVNVLVESQHVFFLKDYRLCSISLLF